MPESQHPLERRAAMLAEKLNVRIDTMAALMRPDGRPVFHDRLPERDALAFWRKHRFDDMGKTVLSTWPADQVMKLDLRLAQANEADGLGGTEAMPGVV